MTTEQKKRKMSDDANSAVKVAVTCSRKQYLTRIEAEQVLTALQKKIISDACNPDKLKMAARPTFKDKALIEDGVIKLWCANHQTRTWLENTISEINTEIKSSPDLRLTIVCQTKVLKRVSGALVIPDDQRVFKESDIWRTLSYQNPQIDFDKSEIHSITQRYGKWEMHVTFPLTEEQKRVLESDGLYLSIGLAEVRLKVAGY